MTERVTRVFELAVPPADVWAFISNAAPGGEPNSVSSDFAITGPRTLTWQISVPDPLHSATIPVETEDTTVEEPTYVEFVGSSRAMRVIGEHELETTEEGTRLTNRFTVDGRLPGVESYFASNLDGELDNLEAAINDAYDA